MRKYVFVGFLVFGLFFAAYWMKCQLKINLVESFSLEDYLPVQSLQYDTKHDVFASEIKDILDSSLGKTQVVNNKSIGVKEEKIVIKTKSKLGQINNLVFGNNLLGYDPSLHRSGMKPIYMNTDFGAGIWDGKWDEKPVNAVINLAKGIAISVVRFPGGCGTHYYDWKGTVGKKRKDYLFGLDEFLRTAKEIGSEVVMTVSYYTGDEESAADLVEYLNSSNDGNNPNSGIDWAARRSQNGHEEPYGIKYFEIGNEVSHGNHKDIKNILPFEYAQRYLKYYQAMKSVDSSIQIGAVLHSGDWNKAVAGMVQENVDFGIIHTYPRPARRKHLETMPADKIFEISLARPIVKDEVNYQSALDILRKNAGRDIPLAITEFNGGFVQDKPVPYRHTMGNALINAELLRVFMKPENNILMANYWQFNNSYWGMVSNGFNGKYETLNNPYFKRPNYYVFQMYHEHFGDVLVDTDVVSDFYDVREYPNFFKSLVHVLKVGKVEGNSLIERRWKISEFLGGSSIEKDGVLAVEFNDPQEFNYYHSVKRTKVEANEYYRLSGYIKTVDLVDKERNGVCLEVQDGRGWTRTQSAMSTQKIKGTTDWQYVETIYKTLPDAKSVSVIARRIGTTGPLEGKAYFKDVKFEKFIPNIDTKIPYLSVNASKSKDGNTLYLMVINKNLEESMTTTIELKDFIPQSKGNAWILNGPAVDSTNEKDHDNVKITHKEFDVGGNSFQFTFEPHSLTALELTGHHTGSATD